MLRNTYTTDELVSRLGLMRKFYEKRLFADGENVTLKEVIESECDEATLEALEEWNKYFTDAEIQPIVIYEALDTVQEDLGGVPAITLYVPVRFTTKQIEGLGIWFRENVQPNILLSLRIDPRTTGGCSFIWKDIYYDFSLRYFIDKQQEEITNMFNTHMHAK